MSSISSSSSYSVGGKSSGSKGIAGLMSGMDTEAMVEKMLSGTQSKIDKQLGLKQQNLWKQEIYREMISSINSFQSKFFDSRYGASSKNNFASNDFFNSMISKIQKGNAVKLLGTSPNAPTGDFKIAVKQLASQATMSSQGPVSGDQTITGTALTDDAMTKLFNKQITFDIGTDSVTVDLNNAKSQDDIAKAVNDQLASQGITDVTAKVHDGKFRLVSDDPNKKISINPLTTTSLGLQMTGMASSTRDKIKDTNGNVTGSMFQGVANMDVNAGPSFDLTLDGVTKTINLSDVERTDTDGVFKTTTDKVKDAIQAQVKKAFGESVTVSLDSNDRLKFGINIKDTSGNLEAGHELTITGMNATNFGIEPGSSNRISGNSKLSSLGLNGDRFSFKINGTEFTFSGDDSISTVMSKINNSDAGVRISYSSISDTFKMENATSGSKYGMEISQTEGDLLTKMFGDKVNSAGSSSSKELMTGYVNGSSLPDDYKAKAPSMKIKVNGQEYTFAMTAKKDNADYTKTEIEDSLNSWLKSKFGVQEGTTDANIAYSDGKLSVAEGFKVEFSKTTIDQDDPKAVAEAMKNDLAYAMGFNKTATSNIAGPDTNIADIKALDGITLLNSSGTAATKLSDIKQIKIGTNSYDATYKDGRLTLSGSGTIDLTSDAKVQALFGSDELKLGDGSLKTGAVTAGKDAVVLVNGVETSRNTNSFTIDGISMELTQESTFTTDASGNKIYDETVISTSRDVDGIVDSFKSFVEDYNKMIETLNGPVRESSDYRKYAPLTDAQKKEMTEKEIELWEKNAKTGLIRSDSTVTTFLSNMRNILYTTPEGSSIALYQIGLETTKNYNDGGKIELDETALRNALSADPDAVRNLFTDATNGLSKQLTAAMDGIAKQSLSAPGSLVQLAGVKGGSTEKLNTLYDRINSIESRIKDLKYKYEKERTRYWNQFNNMEKVLANFNTQSSMISQQFGGGY